jgi:crotonobetainyl-CoA:carnitine CoA-transferase CaiB-like acyl-CoA transferase
VLAGPFASMLLGDLGADVVKVEPPAGDETRAWGPPWWGDPADRRSAYFASVNRNKRSVVLDLRTDADRATLDRLLAGADLLVHNYRPTTAARLGLSPDGLRERHPHLVVARVGGFAGTDADRPAYVLGNHLASGTDAARHGNAHPNIAPYESFEARDGHLVVAVGNDAQFGRLLGVLGLEDEDGRYATNPQRLAGRRELRSWLAEAIVGWERGELTAVLSTAGVPAGPVNSVREAIEAMGEGWIQEVDGIRLAPGPIRVEGELAAVRQPPPRLGEHTDEVLTELT